jgi:cell division protein FtsQ
MKKINWNFAARTALWSSLIIVFLVTLGFSSSKQNGMLCKDVQVVMTDTLAQSFVEAEDVKETIRNKFGALEGKTMGSINISLLEKIINSNPYVANAEVFSSVDGKITVEVRQRNPVVRIVNANDESFYIDDAGVFMPLSEKAAARVPIANGYIFDRFSEGKVIRYTNEQAEDTSLHMIDRIFHVAEFIKGNEFWRAEVEQIFVNAEGDIELVPRIGNHTVIIGDDRNIEGKMEKLFLFYKQSLTAKGWNNYKTINIKFKDQVVCSKN